MTVAKHSALHKNYQVLPIRCDTIACWNLSTENNFFILNVVASEISLLSDQRKKKLQGSRFRERGRYLKNGNVYKSRQIWKPFKSEKL